jgi:heparan-alpha-glucosaminide N-acetyltransferase
VICAILTANHRPLDLVAMASICMAGVTASAIFFESHRWPSTRTRIGITVTFAAAALLAGRLLTPLGISKIRATPTWCLYSIGAATLMFNLLYWLCDVRKKRAWAAFVYPAGENTLLTYLLPDIYYFVSALIGFQFFDTHFNAGAAGVVKALIFSLVMLALSCLLTRARVRLQL